MAQYANNGWAYAYKYDSLQLAKEALDSCWRFIYAYPNSFAKPNVLSYMLKMTAMVSDKKSLVYPLIDSVLTYDTLGSTRLMIGKILIERNINRGAGKSFIKDAFPYLTTDLQRYNALVTLACANIAEGNYSLAGNYYKEALKIYPDNLVTHYEFFALSGYGELGETRSKLKKRINLLEQKKAPSIAKDPAPQRISINRFPGLNLKILMAILFTYRITSGKSL